MRHDGLRVKLGKGHNVNNKNRGQVGETREKQGQHGSKLGGTAGKTRDEGNILQLEAE